MNTLTPTVTANAARQPATTRKVNRATEGCAAGDDATLGCHSTASPWRANASTGNSGTSSPATAGGGSGSSTGSSGDSEIGRGRRDARLPFDGLALAGQRKHRELRHLEPGHGWGRFRLFDRLFRRFRDRPGTTRRSAAIRRPRPGGPTQAPGTPAPRARPRLGAVPALRPALQEIPRSAGDDATLGCHSTASPWRANASTGNSGTSSPATAGGGSGSSTGSSGDSGASSSTTLSFVSALPAVSGSGVKAARGRGNSVSSAASASTSS